jgi:hypothetical protein
MSRLLHQLSYDPIFNYFIIILDFLKKNLIICKNLIFSKLLDLKLKRLYFFLFNFFFFLYTNFKKKISLNIFLNFNNKNNSKTKYLLYK